MLEEDDHHDRVAIDGAAIAVRLPGLAPAGGVQLRSMTNNHNDDIKGLLPELGILPPERDGLFSLTVDQQAVLDAYQAGRMPEADFQNYLASHTALADHVRESTAERGGD